MLVNAKKNYYTANIANCKNKKKSYVFPVNIVQRFGDHFIENVSNIRKDIVECGEDRPYTTIAAMSNDPVFGGV